MSAHTKGPWRTNTAPVIWADGTGFHCIEAGACGAGCGGFSFGSYMSPADARLIAAAPDMLEALQEARLQITYLHEKFAATGSGNAVLARIDAAIAKATGATP